MTTLNHDMTTAEGRLRRLREVVEAGDLGAAAEDLCIAEERVAQMSARLRSMEAELAARTTELHLLSERVADVEATIRVEVEPGQIRVLTAALRLVKTLNEHGMGYRAAADYVDLRSTIVGVPPPVVQRAISMLDRAISVAVREERAGEAPSAHDGSVMDRAAWERWAERRFGHADYLKLPRKWKQVAWREAAREIVLSLQIVSGEKG